MVLFLRVALIVVCVETSIRYALWWHKVGPRWPRAGFEVPQFCRILIKGDAENGILPPLMLGIAAAQAGIAMRHMDVFYYAATGEMPSFWLFAVLFSDVLMLIGTVLHLLPAWELAPGAIDRTLGSALIIRVAIIAVLCLAVLVIEHVI